METVWIVIKASYFGLKIRSYFLYILITSKMICFYLNAPGEIRTPDPLIRSQML